MSTSLVLGIAGAAVGSMVGMPQLGWVLGSMAGSMYDYSRQHSYGPRLDDLKVTSSAYGTAIPYIIGAPRVAGQVWWASDKREIATDTDVGKGGGPTQTTYTYEIDLLVGLGEGELAGVTRMWQNNKLVFTGLATADDASLMASESADLWRRATFYPGNYTQLPDPTYEAAKGDLALAYRGRACIFFEGLQLGNSGQIPSMTFEACSNLLDSGTIVRRASIASTAGTGLQFRTDGTAGVGSPVILGVTPYVRVGIVSNSVLTVYQFDADGVRQADSTRSGTAELMYPGPRDSWSYAAGVIDGRSLRFQFRNVAVGTFGKKIIPVGLFIGPLADGPTEITTGPDLSDCLPAGQFVHAVTTCSDGLHAMVIGGTVAATGGLTSTLWHIVQRSEGVDTLVRSGTIYTAIGDLTFGIAGGHGDQISSFVLENDLLHVWQCTTNTITMWVIGDDGVLRIGSSLTGGAGPDNGSEFYPHPTLWAQDGFCYLISGKSYSRYRRAGTEIQPVTIRRAVEMVCARAGLQSTQFDASPLAAITRPVRGFALGQVGNARGILEQLQTAYQFDVQPGPPLRFVPRGGAAVAAIPYADLGASNEQAQAQPLAIQIASDLELPPRLSLQYLNADDDQQSDTQDSDRLIAGQAAIATLQLGLVLKPAEAKAAADAEAANKLAALTSTQLALSMAYAHLEPADVVEVLDNDGQVYRLRIQRRQDAGGVITLDVVGDDALAPVSAGVTDTDVGGQNVVTALADTLMLPLDIPLLRDQDDGPGYYLAARGNTATWSGATVYSSTNGTDYATAATVAESAVMGVATTTLGNWTGGAVMDEVNTLTVNVAHGQLASTTRAALLADPTVNALLVGDEIIQFVTASLVSTAPNIYTVSRLLRGQRGTEWACTGHAAAERVVLLRTRGLRRVSQQASDLGRTLYIKGVTNGRSAAEVDAETFANTGACLKPWAPVNLRAAPGDGGTYTLTWDRRSRLNVIRDSRGTTIPLGEAAEAYEIDVYDSGASLVASYSATGPTVEIGGPTKVLQYGDGMVWPGEHGGYVYGMQYSYAGAPGRALQRFDGTTGAVLATSTAIAGRVQKMVYTGAGIAYALTIETDASDSYITACKLYRIDLATLAIGSPYDLFASLSRYTYDMAWDGTSVWTATGVGGTVELRSHDATTLAVTATHTLGATSNASLTIAADGAGAIFIGRIDYAKIKAYQPGSSTTLWTVDYGQVGALICTPSLLFADVVGVTSIDPATGAVIVAATEEAFGDFVAYGSDVAYWRLKVTISPAGSNFSGDIVRVLDGTTGAVSRSFPLAFDALAVIGAAAGNLLVRSRSTTSSSATLSHQYGPAAVLAGGSAKVYQISATVGRGYPATVSLP